MKNILVFVVTVALYFLCANSVKADEIAFAFSGVTSGFTEGLPGVNPGDPFSGFVSYNTDDVTPVSNKVGSAYYEFSDSSRFVVTAGPYQFSAKDLFMDLHRGGIETDFIITGSSFTGPSAPLHMLFEMVGANCDESNCTTSPLGNLAPPENVNLQNWAGGLLIDVGGSVPNLNGRAQTINRIFEPSSLSLLVAGLAALWLRSRK